MLATGTLTKCIACVPLLSVVQETRSSYHNLEFMGQCNGISLDDLPRGLSDVVYTSLRSASSKVVSLH